MPVVLSSKRAALIILIGSFLALCTVLLFSWHSASPSGKYGGPKRRVRVYTRSGRRGFCTVSFAGSKAATHPREPYVLTLMPTIPRSGNHLMRLLVEDLTGRATESIYDNEGGQRNNLTRTGGFEPSRCGGLRGNCTHVRGVASAWSLLKTHHPFMEPNIPVRKDCPFGILMTVRHPLDNYLAWMHYRQNQDEDRWGSDLNVTGRPPLRVHPYARRLVTEKILTFDYFADMWEKHIVFWHSLATKQLFPILQFRYEDLCTNPEAISFMLVAFVEKATIPESFGHLKIPHKRQCVMSNIADAHLAGLSYTALITAREVDDVLAKHTRLLHMFDYPDTWEGAHAWLAEMD
ncbi:hypothetical protein DFJ74DRAFT_650981 [Hyaloraphidium curvatum]|nr:hypothetical protein DFJ74DRAFT_650981 [Hyaloraphidium curvatum]